MDPRSPIASRGRSIPEFLKKPIVIYDISRGFSLNIFYCQILYSNGVGSQVLATLVTTLPGDLDLLFPPVPPLMY